MRPSRDLAPCRRCARQSPAQHGAKRVASSTSACAISTQAGLSCCRGVSGRTGLRVPAHLHHTDAGGRRAGSVRTGAGRPRRPDDDAPHLRAGASAARSTSARRGVRRPDDRCRSGGDAGHGGGRHRRLPRGSGGIWFPACGQLDRRSAIRPSAATGAHSASRRRRCGTGRARRYRSHCAQAKPGYPIRRCGRRVRAAAAGNHVSAGPRVRLTGGHLGRVPSRYRRPPKSSGASTESDARAARIPRARSRRRFER